MGFVKTPLLVDPNKNVNIKCGNTQKSKEWTVNLPDTKYLYCDKQLILCRVQHQSEEYGSAARPLVVFFVFNVRKMYPSIITVRVCNIRQSEPAERRWHFEFQNTAQGADCFLWDQIRFNLRKYMQTQSAVLVFPNAYQRPVT